MFLRATRIKFIWGASKVIVARWRFDLWGFYERKQGLPFSGLVISVRGVGLLFLILTILSYLGGTTAVYLWLDRKENNYVTYSDICLLPFRWDEVQVKRGQAYLDDGIANIKAQRWAQGEMKLRLGLARYPHAIKARMTLAEFYFYSQRNALALEVMEEGMDVADNYPGRRYMTNYFTMALQGEDYGKVLETTDRYLSDGKIKVKAKEQDWLFQQKLNALIKNGQAEQAHELLQDAPDNVILNEQRVLVLIELGQFDEALEYLDMWRANDGATAQIMRLQVRTYRELSHPDKMNAILEELRQLSPADPRTYAFAVIQRKLIGLDQQADESLQDYFFRFGGFAANTLLIAQPLAEIGATDMLSTCVERATEQGYDLRPILLLQAKAQLKRGYWSSAQFTTRKLGTMSTMGRSRRELDEAELAGILSDVANDPSEGPQVALLKNIESHLYVFQNYRMIVDTLMRAQRYALALEVIGQCEHRFPRNHGLEAYKSEATAVLSAQQDEADTLEVKIASPMFVEKAFFNRVDQAMSESKWTAAASMIRDVQQARPTWLKSREADVLSRQMRVSHGAHATLQMSLAARLLLDGSLARSLIVVDYAMELHNQGETDIAVRLLREVVRKMPNHALARRYLDEWTEAPTEVGEPEMDAKETP